MSLNKIHSLLKLFKYRYKVPTFEYVYYIMCLSYNRYKCVNRKIIDNIHLQRYPY